MKYLLLACAAVALAACSPAPDDAVNVAGKRVPLADCADVKVENSDEDGIRHPDCRALFPDASGLAYEARYAPAEDDSTKITLVVVQPGDAVKQKIEERMGNTLDSVGVKDLDADGKVDLWIPLETEDNATTWAIWRQAAEGHFERIGEPQGDVTMTAAGLFAAKQVAEDGAVSVDFYKLDGSDLRLLVTADASTGNKGITCNITPGDHFTMTGLTLEMAHDQFCAEPVLAPELPILEANTAPAETPSAAPVKDTTATH